MNNCTLCGGELTILDINNEYLKCNTCSTQIKKDVEPFDVTFYDNTYLKDIELLKNTISLNKVHYDKLFIELCKDDVYNKFIDDITSTVTTTVCYGGGWPQIESMLPPSKIIVCDLIAQNYKNLEYIFSEKFDITNKEISYQNYDIGQGIIKYKEPLLLTFIHILEHLSGSQIKNILFDINENVRSGSFGLIYQPNPKTAINNGWWHYAQEHITLPPPEALANLINDYTNLNVILYTTFSEDMLIIFKKI